MPPSSMCKELRTLARRWKAAYMHLSSSCICIAVVEWTNLNRSSPRSTSGWQAEDRLTLLWSARLNEKVTMIRPAHQFQVLHAETVLRRRFSTHSSSRANGADISRYFCIGEPGLHVAALHGEQQRQEDLTSPLLRPMTQVEGYRCEVSYGDRNPSKAPKGLPAWNSTSVFCFAAVRLGPTVTPASTSAARFQEPGLKCRRACVQLLVFPQTFIVGVNRTCFPIRVLE